MKGSPRVFLIDGTAFCYRAFYAIRNLSTADGRPTNAVYGFATMLQALRDKEQPDYLAVAFDVGKPTFRHERFEEYKIQRKPMPDRLIGQLPLIKQLLAAYQIPVFEQEGYEAEDVLATITAQVAKEHCEVVLVTGDKDLLQLVNSHVKVYNPHKEDALFDAEAVKTRYGIGPERMVDLMALMGDAIDNIPGVPGIGEKTATQLLQRFGSLDALYEHLDELEPAKRDTLQQHREQVERARELATIVCNAPVSITLGDLKLQEPDWRALRKLFRELDFKRLLKTIDAHAPQAATPSLNVTFARQAIDLEAVCAWLTRATNQPTAILGWPVGDGEALLLVVASSPEQVVVIPLDTALLQTPIGKRLAAWLAEPRARKISHDAKRLIRALKMMHGDFRGLAGDTMIAAHLLNPARTTQTLSDLSDEYLEEPLGALPVPDGLHDLGEESLQHFGRAVVAVLRLHERLQPSLEAQGLGTLYTELELPLLQVLAQMETVGIAIDVPYLAGLRASMDAKLLRLTEEIYQLAGGAFNVNSPKQLARVLFEQLALPIIKRTKTGPSTDSDVLRQLSERHPLPKQLMEYRELSKLVSTYVEALPKLVNPATGRLHTSFNQTATATGRLSSSDPNLQNIPIKTELGRSIRKAFIPGIPEGVLLAADYSQIELRILAHLSGDEQLTEAFHQKRDIHRFTASLIYGLPETEVQPEQRNAMKAVNFGILYGMSAHGLSKELGLSFEDAQAFIEAYFQRYPKVRQYLDEQIAQARRDGFVQTLLGRRRYIPEVNSREPMLRQVGERMAINAPVQGTAADLIKRAMVELAHELERQRLASRMVLQVHDELVFEAKRSELEVLVPLIRRVMEGAIALRVPLTVTMKAGPNWLELEPVH